MHIIQQKILGQLTSRDFKEMKLREIGVLIGEEHPQKIKHHLNQLLKKGLIKINKSSNVISSISAGQVSEDNFISIPIFGSVNCGQATMVAEERLEGILRVSKSFIPHPNSRLFAVKAVGNSMNKADINGKNIEEGDYVIVDGGKRTPINNDYVLSVMDGLANIKKFVKDSLNNQYILISESTEEYSPIYIHQNDFADYTVNGTVIEVIKKPNN